jgi:predicted ester cyclase
MRTNRMLFLIAIVCASLTLTADAQKRPAQAQGGSAQQNEAKARKVFEEMVSGGRFGEANQVFDPNCKVHFGNRNLGFSQAEAEGRGWKSAAPDLVMRVQQISSNGDKVNINWVATGTHTGQGIGQKATGRHFNMRGTTQFVFRNGKIVEVMNSEYRTELFRQLGISKTAASMFDSTERLWAAVSQLLPDPLYASLR